jgi:cytochrome c553
MPISRLTEVHPVERTSMTTRVRNLYWIAFVVLVVAGAAIVNYSPGAQAQTASAGADKKDGLQAVYATTAEVAEGKRIAQATCVRCHGLDGISTAKGVPHLAGQRPAYLYLELRAYQSGARGKKVMDGAVEFLSATRWSKSLPTMRVSIPRNPSQRAGQSRPNPTRRRRARQPRPPARVVTVRAASARRPACRASSRWNRNTLSQP